MVLSDAIDAFLADRKAKRYAAGTIRGQSYTLKNLLGVVGNVHVHNMTVVHMDRMFAANPQWGPGSINRVIAQLSVFFGWCQSRGYMPKDRSPLDDTRYVKVPQRPRLLIPQDQFSTFLGGIKNPRYRAATAIGLYLFTRVSETRYLRWQADRGDQMDVWREKTQTTDTLPLCMELREELDRWKFTYGRLVGETVRPSWYIIPGTSPNRFGPGGRQSVAGSLQPTRPASGLGDGIKQVLMDADYYQPHEGGHTLRRSGATALADRLAYLGHDRSMRIVQAMLGHKHLVTTEIYLRRSLDEKVANDLLAGQKMFSDEPSENVIDLRRVSDA